MTSSPTRLDWSSSSDTTQYDTYLKNNTASSYTKVCSNTSSSYCDLSASYTTGTYSWYVKSENSTGSTNSDTWSFTIEEDTPLPGKATNPTPSNGTSMTSSPTRLDWSSSSDTTQYNTYLKNDTTSSFSKVCSNTTNSYCDFNAVYAIGSYSWYVESENSAGTTSSDTWSFTIESSQMTLSIITENGSVTGEGINCPSDCSESYTQESASNSLTATPSEGYKFNNWNLSDNCSSTDELTQTTINITLSGDCSVTASFTTISDSAPILSITQNLESCITKTNNKCVVLGQTAKLKFDIIDNNNNLSRLDVNWDGVSSPEKSHSISGGNVSIESSSDEFTSADIADCPNNEYYRNDNVCWKKDITVTATAYDASDNPSNVFSQEFILYDNDGYKLAKEALENAKKELEDKENLLEQQSSQETAYASDVESLMGSCQVNKKLDWEKKNTLLEYDPFRVTNNIPEYCRKDRATLISCASIDSQCSGLAGLGIGINYEIKTTYDYQSYVVGAECKNYPARVESSYTIDGIKTVYETDYVNNHAQKTDYLINVSTRLKDELIIKSGDRYVGKCNIDDYKEWTIKDWVEKVSEHEDFNRTVALYAQENGLSKAEATKGVADGIGKALHEIANEYKELPGTVKDTISEAFSLIGSFIGDPSGTSARVKEEAIKIGGLAQQIGAEIVEIIPTLPNAIDHLSVYEKSFFTAYVTTLVAHEVAPTSKLKLLKLNKLTIPKWLIEATLYVRVHSLGFTLPKANLDSLDINSRNFVSNELKRKEDPFSDRDLDLAKLVSSKDIKRKQFIANIIRGNRFNIEQWDKSIKNELYLCKSPNGCSKDPKQYVRLDAYDDTIDPALIISRKHTQFSKISIETAKNYLDELSKKYKPGMKGADVPSNITGTKKNTTNVGMAGMQINGTQVLQIPTQDRLIPNEIQDYADSLDIDIRQVPTSIH
jgi:hypothetical protein